MTSDMGEHPVPADPEQVAQLLDQAGETAAAVLVRAMVGELAAVRGERDTLAAFARHIARLAGGDLSHNSRLIVRAHKVLDSLRVTRRCPVAEDGRHRPLRSPFDVRCWHCHVQLPERG
jgi:hypothetical protein